MNRSVPTCGLTLGAAFLALGMAVTAEAAPAKVDICHIDDEGVYQLINVSERALPAHRGHGDALPGEEVPDQDGVVFAEDCTFPVAEEGDLLTADGADEGAGVRYKGQNSGNEIYLGIPNLGRPEPGIRVEAGFTWVDLPGEETYTITFAFNQAGNAVTTSIDGPGGAASLTYDFDNLRDPGCPTAEWDALVIRLADRLTDGALELRNVDIDGNSLGDFGTFDVQGTSDQAFTVTGFDFSQDFVVSGNLAVENFTGNERMRLELIVGCLPS